MTQVANDTRQFSVHARHVDSHHARLLEEKSFEAAAVAYVEDFHPPLTDDHEISVVVPRSWDWPRALLQDRPGVWRDCPLRPRPPKTPNESAERSLSRV